MTAADFAAFVTLCKERHHWSAAELSRRLGCGRNMIAEWQRKDPPKYIGLACSALVFPLPEWKSV